MKSTNKKHHFIETILSNIVYIIPIVLLILILSYIVSFFQIEKRHIQEKSVTLFKESVKEDFHNRSQGLTEKVSLMDVPSAITTPDSCIFRSETIEVKAPAQSNQSLDEKLTAFLQSILSFKNPINIHQLDTIFQQKLEKENIHITTAVCMTDTINKKGQKCTRFNMTSFDPLFTEPYIVSSTGITLNAYIKISGFTLIRRIPTSSWIAFIGWILFTSSIGCAWYNLRKKMPVLVEGYVKREKTLQEELTQKKNELAIFKQLETYKKDSDIHIFSPNLVFEKDTKTLRYREEIVKLTLQQQQLLAMFCNAPENTCSINDLRNLVWKDCKVEENTIHQAISRLNNTLKNQGLHIQYEFKDSYKLIFKGNGLPTPCQS